MKIARFLTAIAFAVATCGTTQAQVSPEFYSGRTLDDGQMQVGRYTTMAADLPEVAARPLDVYAQLNFPRQVVQTVGDAIRYTLMRTGWRLVDQGALQPQAARLLDLPLPESQRTVGPYRVRTVLQVLTGQSWTWHEDQVQRQVWFSTDAGEIGSSVSDLGSDHAITSVVTESAIEQHGLSQQDATESARSR
jgi:type IV pili sensor histidine kinase/response regulator